MKSEAMNVDFFQSYFFCGKGVIKNVDKSKD